MSIIEFIGQIAVPVLALIISGISFYFTNRMNKKVNKKDYEISENLKYELMRLIAALKSMDAKAVLAPHFKQEMDYSREIDILADLQTSPGYLLFLHSIKDDDKRFEIDTYMKMLVVNGNSFSQKDIRLFSNRILNFFKKDSHLKDVLDIDVLALLDDLCTMRGTAPEFDESKAKSDNQNQKFEELVTLLVESGNTDPDVLLFYAVFQEDKDLIDKAISAGANLNTTDKDLIKRYQQEYDALCAEN